MKKLLALTLCIFMVLSIIPSRVFAAEGDVNVKFYMSAEDKTPVEKTFKKGTKIEIPEEVTKKINEYKQQNQGKTLDAWYTNLEKNEKFDITQPIPADFDKTELSLYAKFKDIEYVEVTFVIEEKNEQVVRIEKGTSVEGKAPKAEVEGKKFSHWSEIENGDAFDLKQAITENKKLYAVYEVEEPAPVEKVTVTFMVDDKENSKSEINKGEKVTKPADPKKDGHTFKHWAKEKDGKDAFNFETPIEENITLYAVFEKVVEKVTVTFMVDDKENSKSEINKGEKVTKPADPKKDGYTFKHWAKEKDGKDAFDFETPIEENTTLYAVFEKEPEKITLALHSNDPIDIASTAYIKIEPSKDFELTKDLIPFNGVRGNYTFVGWYTKQVGGTKVTKVNSKTDITLYAHWEKDYVPDRPYDRIRVIDKLISDAKQFLRNCAYREDIKTIETALRNLENVYRDAYRYFDGRYFADRYYDKNFAKDRYYDAKIGAYYVGVYRGDDMYWDPINKEYFILKDGKYISLGDRIFDHIYWETDSNGEKYFVDRNGDRVYEKDFYSYRYYEPNYYYGDYAYRLEDAANDLITELRRAAEKCKGVCYRDFITYPYIDLSYYGYYTRPKEEVVKKEEAIERKAYMQGVPGGNFNPDGTLTRAELAQILANILNINGYTNRYVQNVFVDVPYNSWYKNAVDNVVTYGIMTGKPNGRFDANGTLTKAELITIAVRLKGFTPIAGNIYNLNTAKWAQGYIQRAYVEGYLSDYKTLNPNSTITRKETVRILNKVLGYGVDRDYISKARQMVVYRDVNTSNPYYYDILAATNNILYVQRDNLRYWIDHKTSDGRFYNNKVKATQVYRSKLLQN